MGIQLPGEVRTFLHIIGFTFPAGDETKLLDLGQEWLSLADKIEQHVEQAKHTAEQVWNQNSSDMVEAFKKRWMGEAGPANRMGGGAIGSNIVGAGVMVCAGIVLAMKINAIVQATLTLIEIAAALAAATFTFGASATIIPLLKEACKRLLDYLLGEAINKVLAG
ncbi:MAG TPA: hypothetical protein VFC19_47005 [Candidatus Limnocylindrales bacterium]|nr:hypothetical protein [Candidatus Limnocylindrales bacterium]